MSVQTIARQLQPLTERGRRHLYKNAHSDKLFAASGLKNRPLSVLKLGTETSKH
jgi:hypothetical protein